MHVIKSGILIDDIKKFKSNENYKKIINQLDNRILIMDGETYKDNKRYKIINIPKSSVVSITRPYYDDVVYSDVDFILNDNDLFVRNNKSSMSNNAIYNIIRNNYTIKHAIEMLNKFNNKSKQKTFLEESSIKNWMVITKDKNLINKIEFNVLYH